MSDLFDSVKDAEPMEEKGVSVNNAPTTPMIAGTDSLLQMAISKDLDIAKLEKLIEMKNREEERQCKKDFDFHFSEMQKDYRPAVKTGEVMNQSKTTVLYKFCSLEDILKVYAPIIAKHGFSFKWKEEMSGDNKSKKITCFVSGYGHEESSSVDIPIEAGNSFTNSIQQRGVSTSYGKRYSFINAFGVIIEGEDNDALSFNDGVQYADEVMAIENCDTPETLRDTWKAIYNKLDMDGRKIMFRVYEKKKKELVK